MRRTTNVALVSLGLLLGTAGCDSFLTGDKLSQDPNRPTIASAQQLFIGVQAGQFAFQEGTVAMMMCEWVQSCSAGNSRFVQQAAQYVFNETSNIAANGGDWINAYAGGGLVDIKRLEDAVGAANDSVWLGITQMWEALTMGTVSSMWGDVPYSEAVSGKTSPVLDDRFVILGNLQTLLTTAIANLQKTGTGPGVNDLVFGGDVANWTKAAWTLKARYYMQTAESLPATAYTAAIAAALNGISDPTGASDFSSFHTTATSERNMWTQFQTSSGFGTDLEAGQELVNILKARNDPRLAKYYCKATTAAWKTATKYKTNGAILDPNGNMEQVTAVTLDSMSGATQPVWPTLAGAPTVDNHVTWINRGLPYVGDDFNTPPPPPVSNFTCLPPRFQADARIPYVGYVENQLILAEAYHSQPTPDDVSALNHLNSARATVPLPALAGITGAALLDSIMIEKYAAMYQNIESINDYRRTCIPNLTPSKNSQNFRNVPGRLFYPQNERNVNTNVPDPSVQLATHGFRNKGDVLACTVQGVP